LARRLELDERYLAWTARRLVSPMAWRASTIEQQALVAELPLLEASLGRVRTPTVIVGGVEDRIVPGASLRRLSHQIPGAELVMLSDVGHLLPMRRPGELADVIARP
jgi:pimeloyl-ACP methyl ester carboxylesterase